MHWRVESMRMVILPCCSPFGPVKSIRSTLPLRPGESAVAKASPKRGNAEGIFPRDTV